MVAKPFLCLMLAFVIVPNVCFGECEQVFTVSVQAITSEDLKVRLQIVSLDRTFENSLFEKLIIARQSGDTQKEQDIAVVLLAHIQRLLFKLVKSFKIPRLHAIEALDQVNSQIMLAFPRFDPTRGFRFATFAHRVAKLTLIRIYNRSKHISREIAVSQIGDADSDSNVDDAYFQDDEQPYITPSNEVEELSRFVTLLKAAVENPNLLGLTKKQATVLRLKYPQDGSEPLTNKEILELGILRGTSRNAPSDIIKQTKAKIKRFMDSATSEDWRRVELAIGL